MILITKALEKTFAKYPLYSQDSKGIEAIVLAKFSGFTWYVTEAEKQANGDYMFFGYVDGLDAEFGYFTLSQLKSVRSRYGLAVERDRYFNNGKTTLAEVMHKFEAAY